MYIHISHYIETYDIIIKKKKKIKLFNMDQ